MCGPGGVGSGTVCDGFGGWFLMVGCQCGGVGDWCYGFQNVTNCP